MVVMDFLNNPEVAKKLANLQTSLGVTSKEYEDGFHPCKGCGGGATNCNGNF